MVQQLFLLSFRWGDLFLIGLLIIALTWDLLVGENDKSLTDSITLLFGVTLGKGASLLLKYQIYKGKLYDNTKMQCAEYEIQNFLILLTLLLVFSSWWHLGTANNFYHGPRWMGLWNNPNDYGMLMGAGLILAVGLLAPKCKAERENRMLWFFFLFIMSGMMMAGLLFSYSRGAWLGTCIGFLYLARAYGKLKWPYLLPIIFVAIIVILVFWRGTSDTSPWYIKRLDFSRASVQHRISAWKAGFEIMWDYPFGVGWNRAMGIYEKNYSPLGNGAGAITTNDYLMLGTQLGFSGLLCFLAYVALCFRNPQSVVSTPQSKIENPKPAITLDPMQIACRAGTLAMLVAFWFDGGLFKLATASVFWILLELGADRPAQGHLRKAPTLAIN